jgi:hypothetical protein
MIFLILLTVIVLAPILFGAIFPWSWTLLASLVNLLLLAWVAESIMTRRPPAVSFRMIWPIAVPFALTAVWIAVQMMPGLPQQWHHPMWASAAEILGQDVGGSISVDPSGHPLSRPHGATAAAGSAGH